MSFSTEFFADKQYFISVVASLINDERSRIVSSKLAADEDIKKFLDSYINRMRAKIASGQETNSIHLSNLHLLLQSVKLPGDFNHIASEEKFYEALDVPYKGEKFHDLSSLKEEKEEPKVEKLQEALEEYVGKEENHVEDCACDMCFDKNSEAQLTLAQAVNNRLAQIVYVLGNRGDHNTAYMIEQAMRSIKVSASNGKLFNFKK